MNKKEEIDRRFELILCGVDDKYKGKIISNMLYMAYTMGKTLKYEGETLFKSMLIMLYDSFNDTLNDEIQLKLHEKIRIEFIKE